jgi:hypothetical protein
MVLASSLLDPPRGAYQEGLLHWPFPYCSSALLCTQSKRGLHLSCHTHTHTHTHTRTQVSPSAPAPAPATTAAINAPKSTPFRSRYAIHAAEENAWVHNACCDTSQHRRTSHSPGTLCSFPRVASTHQRDTADSALDRELISTPDVSQKKRPVVAIVGGSFGVLPPPPLLRFNPMCSILFIRLIKHKHIATVGKSGAISTSPEQGAIPLHTRWRTAGPCVCT